LAFVASRGRDAPPLLLRAARRLKPLDLDLARETYLEALSAGVFAGRLARPGGGALEVALAARAAPAPPRAPRPIDLLLDGLATLFSEGYAPAVPVLRRARKAFGGDMVVAEELRWLTLATASAVHLWDDEGWHTLSERHVQLAREAGALGELPLALSQRVFTDLFAGELTAAGSLVEAVQAATEATGCGLAPYGALGLAALRGREAEARALISASRAEVLRRGDGLGITVIDWAEAVLHNGLGRYEEARAAALRVCQHVYELSSRRPGRLPSPPHTNWCIVELIEAGVRSGQPEVAALALRHLEARQATRSDWGLGIAARSRALLTDGATAEALYRDAIDRLGRTRVRADLARAHLLYGEWLRRERRRREAREQLRHAESMFRDFGMEAFAARASIELKATGERARKRTSDTRDDLTPQEAEVCRLAADGATNVEIAARLFLSPRTVDYHLRKVFRKLGVNSRHHLARQRSVLGTTD
jgi:DNA-binding CsgD family transcriptional regulator